MEGLAMLGGAMLVVMLVAAVIGILIGSSPN